MITRSHLKASSSLSDSHYGHDGGCQCHLLVLPCANTGGALACATTEGTKHQRGLHTCSSSALLRLRVSRCTGGMRSCCVAAAYIGSMQDDTGENGRAARIANNGPRSCRGGNSAATLLCNMETTNKQIS